MRKFASNSEATPRTSPKSEPCQLAVPRLRTGWQRTFFVSESGFSAELDRFIAAEIQSLEQLEILLLLSGNPHKWWTSGGVYEVVKSSLPSVEGRLKEMANRKVLITDAEGRYQFAPAHQDYWKLVSELREAYKERSVKVVQAIYSARSTAPDAVQEFARAFRVRKD